MPECEASGILLAVTPSPSPRRILILYAHPAPHKSRVNRQLAAAVRELPGITFHDLYEAYPDLGIDVPYEQRLLLAHDLIVLQHPFYWYSTPAILKEWADLVLEYGFAYGEGGDKLAGKAWLHALTAGGPLEAYTAEGYNRFRVRELLAPWDQTAHLCGMHFLSPFTVHRTLRLDPAQEIPTIAAEYRAMLEFLRDTRLDWPALSHWERINEHWRALATPSTEGGAK